MKKLFVLLTVFLLILSLAACGKENTPEKPTTEENLVSGLVTSEGSVVEDSTNKSYDSFDLLCDDGRIICFVITDETELVWEDKSAFRYWSETTDPWIVFGEMLYVNVVCEEDIENFSEDELIYRIFDATKITVTGINEDYSVHCNVTSDKPVIYLYPEEETEVEVKLDYNGTLTCTYPRYNNGWRVTASPDGTLRDESGQEYNYLYWEGKAAIEFDFSKGFCVKGEDTAAFLENALSELGLTRREANEFIVYWLPLMEKNPYNIISFQSSTYTDTAVLNVTPAPDTVLRVYMAWKCTDTPIDIEPQILTSPERTGFTLVEWGGTEVR